MANREGSRRHLVAVVLIASILGATVLGLTGWLERQPGLLIEVIFYPILAGWLASIRVLRNDILLLPKAYRRGFLTFVGLAVIAQFLGGGGDLFPGARWAMFSDHVSNANGTVIVVELDSGQVRPLDPADLYGSLRNGRAESLMDRISSSEREDLLLAYANRIESLEPDIEVRSIRIVETRPKGTQQFNGVVELVTILEVRHDP